MFDKDLENKYVFDTRLLKGKQVLEKWHPTKYQKIMHYLGDYHVAILGSIDMDVITKDGLDTLTQIISLINKYTEKKIQPKVSNKERKERGITLIKKWNPDNYDELVVQLTDDELILLSQVSSDIISQYGLNTIMDIKLCIKLNETKKSGGSIKVDVYNGNLNEFLYNTFISHRKICSNTIDTGIDVNNFNYELFGELMNNCINTYLLCTKLNKK